MAAMVECRAHWDSTAVVAAVRSEHLQVAVAADCRKSTQTAQMPAAPQSLRRAQTTRRDECGAPSRSNYGLGQRELAAPG